MKRWRLVLLAFIGLFLTGVALYFLIRPQHTHFYTPLSNNQAEQSVKPSRPVIVSHIFIIVMENQPASLIAGNNQNAPYTNSLIKKYSLATNYYAVAHPSLPNYIALTSGSTNGINTDCNPPSAGCIVNVPNIADEIEHSGRTWKEYAESMPSPCYAFNSGNYATKHNPFIYYSDIIGNKSRCNAHVVPFNQLNIDLKSQKTTPNYAFITPNLCNDMHNCSIDVGDYWLSQNVPLILNSPAFKDQRSLLFITWDEGDSTNNNVALVIAGSAAKQDYHSSATYSHYSILATIEKLWGLKPLTANDRDAMPLTEFIR